MAEQADMLARITQVMQSGDAAEAAAIMAEYGDEAANAVIRAAFAFPLFFYALPEDDLLRYMAIYLKLVSYLCGEYAKDGSHQAILRKYAKSCKSANEQVRRELRRHSASEAFLNDPSVLGDRAKAKE